MYAEECWPKQTHFFFSLTILLLGRSPSYKIGFLRRSQMAKRGLLRVRHELGESGPVT